MSRSTARPGKVSPVRPSKARPRPGATNPGPEPTVAAPPAIAPLNVSGLVISRSDLVTALRVYLPQLADVSSLDGERFLLSLSQPRETGGGGDRG